LDAGEGVEGGRAAVGTVAREKGETVFIAV
jgi:hypothetical protein